jgi:hypothetical protein
VLNRANAGDRNTYGYYYGEYDYQAAEKRAAAPIGSPTGQRAGTGVG